MNKYYLVKLSYNGIRYFGWQKQKQFPSVHQAFEDALKNALPQETEFHTIGASRTDARVHALGQVVRVNLTDLNLEPAELKRILNQNLPFDIRAENVIRTHSYFKVIAFAKDKEYLYLFQNKAETRPWMFPYTVNFEEELNFNLMAEAAKLFVGEYDFKNYCYRAEHVSNTVRKVYECELIEQYQMDLDGIQINSHALRIRGAGFLKQMVRIIMGTLVQIGNGTVTIEQVRQSLECPQNRQKLGFIAPPHGLFLHFIKYPQKYMDLEL